DGFWRQDLGRLGDWTTSSLVPDGSRVLVAPAAPWSGRRLICRDLARACAGRDRGKVSSPTDKRNGGLEIGSDLAAKLPTQEKHAARGAPHRQATPSGPSWSHRVASPLSSAGVDTLIDRWHVATGGVASIVARRPRRLHCPEPSERRHLQGDSSRSRDAGAEPWP